MPSSAVDDLFSDDSFDVDFHSETIGKLGTKHLSNMQIVNNIVKNNMDNIIGVGHANDHNNQCDGNTLGSSNRSSITQASDIVFQQPKPDPFSQPMLLEEQQRQQESCVETATHLVQQQLQQQQQRQQECKLLRQQIQQLQDRIVYLNHHPQQQQQQHQWQTIPNMTNKSNYLCNGVAAIEPSDRGTVTPTISPGEIGLRSNNVTNFPNHPLNQLQKNPDELLLNPTPIYTPLVPLDSSNNLHNQDGGTTSGGDTDNMRRSFSFCSFPQAISTSNPM
jgi:hypothetical protein